MSVLQKNTLPQNPQIKHSCPDASAVCTLKVIGHVIKRLDLTTSVSIIPDLGKPSYPFPSCADWPPGIKQLEVFG